MLLASIGISDAFIQPGKGKNMSTMKRLIQRHALLTYCGLTILLSWGSLFFVIGPGGFLGTEAPSEAQMPLMFVAVLTGPSLAGLLVTGIVHGRAGLRVLWMRLRKWRVGVGWYAIALLTAPLLINGILYVLSRVSPAYLPTIATNGGGASLLAAGMAGALAAGILEEIGWTGFAVPEMRRRHGPLVTGLIVGGIWGAWHYPLFAGSAAAAGNVPPALYLAVLLFAVLPPFRVLMVWVHDHTESLLLAILMHASLTGSTLIFQPAATGVQTVIYDLLLAGALWAIAGCVLLFESGRLSRKVRRHPAAEQEEAGSGYSGSPKAMGQG